MEVTGLGLLNMDDYRASPAASAASTKNFEEILRRAGAASSIEAVSSREAASSMEAVSSREAVSSGPSKTKIDKSDKLYQLCLELETFLVKNLLTTMRNTVQKSGLIDEGFAGKMYEDMLYDEYAKNFTKNANFGLAEQAYLQLKGK